MNAPAALPPLRVRVLDIIRSRPTSAGEIHAALAKLGDAAPLATLLQTLAALEKSKHITRSKDDARVFVVSGQPPAAPMPMLPAAGSINRRVLAHLQAFGPATGRSIEVNSQISGNVRGALYFLRLRGLVEVVDTRKTVKNVAANVWGLTAAAEKLLDESKQPATPQQKTHTLLSPATDAPDVDLTSLFSSAGVPPPKVCPVPPPREPLNELLRVTPSPPPQVTPRIAEQMQVLTPTQIATIEHLLQRAGFEMLKAPPAPKAQRLTYGQKAIAIFVLIMIISFGVSAVIAALL